MNGNPSDSSKLVRSDGAGAVKEHWGLGGVEDGGFEADSGGAGVEDSVYAAV